ncbi:SDR family NAD(P)-dependent oxidoreductase [Nocardia terpenica]|uniref:oxidoreductase n=1 Tax=Nocardia terpenica TaxID=455432 RepID=UPI00189368E8|nr:oxidoreductase [Nocardia terpenica]MBF6061558.1 SDR family NAD(P)-dependent oxidoreductase [Nocardia terpenica]MBF6107647.1 SDR family NAD(P)-dependent oxidoreductase [Nocardia terpenica]MBF6109978.1 SDR family NAD(P)-dependent oxidoreductase [Nocardia terpenica]MBF6122510.1 SDR family NAD(P)-dependent oxidoreductase [Nocardia terpenica]MBF6151314.1 SDR family NAD(P)-dependent oxidoreductase [Nocardia terpenica]
MTNKVWFITGAAAGFGRTLTEAAVAAGDTVVAAVRNTDKVADLVESSSGAVTAVQLDVTDTARIDTVVAETIARHGRIDVLVNNAGKGLIGAIEEIPDAALRHLMDVHVFGPANLIRAVLPHMRERRSGAIVQFSSQGGRYSFPGVGVYSATKFALEGLSEALSLELAPLGIHVLLVEPGPFRTSFNTPGVLEFAEDTIADYETTVRPVCAALADADGKQAGDPVAAARVIRTVLESDNPPLRLALGNEAVDTIGASLDKARAELDAWATLARSADYTTIEAK